MYDHSILFWIFKGDMTGITYAKFNGFLIVGYFSNRLFECHTMPLNLLEIRICSKGHGSLEAGNGEEHCP